MRGVLFSDSVRINDAISVRIPLVGDVWENEDDYFAAVSSIISTPYDMMVQLDDNGIDFSKLDKFELFCMLFGGLQKMDTRLIFGELDLTKFSLAKNTKSNELVLYDSGHGIAIDRAVHEQISTRLVLRFRLV